MIICFYKILKGEPVIMDTTIKVRTVQSLLKDIAKGKINFTSYLQRKEGQWLPAQQSKFIDTLMRGYPIPPVYAVAYTTPEGESVQTIIDGCQRLSTLRDFTENKGHGFKLKKLDTFAYDGKVEVEYNGLMYYKLPEELQDKIMASEIQVITLEDASPEDIVEIFDRLNNGVALSKAQKNKTVMGYELAMKVRELANLPVMSRLGLTPGQVKKDENEMVICQTFMLCSGTSTGLSAKEVKEFLKGFANSISKDEIVNGVAKSLSILDSIIGNDEFRNVKKSMVAPRLYTIYGIKDDEGAIDRFNKNFHRFISEKDTNEEYAKFAKFHTTSRENTEGRVAFLQELTK